MVKISNYILTAVLVCQTLLIIALVYHNFHISLNNIHPTKKKLNRSVLTQPVLTLSSAKRTDRGTLQSVNKQVQLNKIFYNRVPKCGSRTIIELIKTSAETNKFQVHELKEYSPYFHEDEYNYKTVETFEESIGPFLLEGHYHFLEFSKYNGTQPTYINVIRDPIERMRSFYYFRRFQPDHIRDMDNATRYRSFDECVSKNIPECVEPLGNSAEEGYYKIIPFFCGHEPFCRKPTRKALDKAIYNVENYFAVVGLTEYLKETTEVLDYFLPLFFSGIYETYLKKQKNVEVKYKTIKKSALLDKTATFMRDLLAIEYEFYQFIRQKFMNQLTIVRKSYGKKLSI
ncbi:DgyrCDS7905 [Dimorphilus gyrociliatus]|uniref:DgyrCDS7905 n=1 Tax=Dimorphilus gyrociliatus TaxID=2664684 RepID=A0A7I8VTK1_9ANNE|nr:DgyrCDS7905 [Dimorphilus gyrociliatus]